MRVLFCHDGPITKDQYGNYYWIAHNDKTFKRYYNIAEELAVVIRVKEIPKEEIGEKLSKISVSPFEVIKCYNTNSLKGVLVNRRKNIEIIKKEIKKSDYVIVRLPSMIGFIASKYAKKYKVPCFVEVVACPWDAFWNHSMKGKLVAPFMWYYTKKHIKNSKYVLYVTNQFLQKRYPTRGKNIGCSDVALKDFNDSILEKRIDKIDHSKGKLVLGTTAAVNVRYKGQQYVIEALGKLKKEGITDFEYQLVGSGDTSYLNGIAKRYGVEENVKFIGSLSHEQVFEWLDKIDIYIQPSRQEGLPRGLVEAMSRGLPAVGARTGGIPELIKEKYIFSNSNQNIDEICRILKSYSKETLSQQAKENFEIAKQYTFEELNVKREEFYREFRESL